MNTFRETACEEVGIFLPRDGREKERDLEVEGKKELTLGQEKTGVEFDLAINTQLVGLCRRGVKEIDHPALLRAPLS